MKCPIDGATLLMTTRSGVEIDYCPECRGVWLDRGELDKIIEREESEIRSLREEATSRQEQRPTQDQQVMGSNIIDAVQQQLNKNRYYDDDDYHKKQKYDDRYDSKYYKKKKRSSFLGDLLDFG
ncbi:MAG TPA: hypothetical protein DEB24_02120 [Coriobacteriia bacterium]|nr:hypothetical protein [Coriobacteriia bacterium]